MSLSIFAQKIYLMGLNRSPLVAFFFLLLDFRTWCAVVPTSARAGERARERAPERVRECGGGRMAQNGAGACAGACAGAIVRIL